MVDACGREGPNQDAGSDLLISPDVPRAPPFKPRTRGCIAKTGVERRFRSSASSGGGFGLGSMLNLMIVGPMLYRMGGQPWSPQTFIASLKANPINAIMLLSMVSNWIF